MQRIKSELPEFIKKFGASRIVVDSVSLLNMLFDNDHERRTNLFNLSQMIKRTGATCLMTAEVKDDNPLCSRDGLVEYVADGVISLRYVERLEKSELQLSVRIIKMRRTNHSRKITPYSDHVQGHRGPRGVGDQLRLPKKNIRARWICRFGASMKLYRVGKVKKVWEVDDDSLEFEFTDNISVFDKIIPTEIPFKGETLCRTSAYWLKLCEEHGIRTDFKRLNGPNRMLVKRVDVIPDYDQAEQHHHQLPDPSGVHLPSL